MQHLYTIEYTDTEKKTNKNWGHSFLSDVLDIGYKGNIENLLLSHHNPHKINFNETQETIKLFLKKHNNPFKCTLAEDGLTLSL